MQRMLACTAAFEKGEPAWTEVPVLTRLYLDKPFIIIHYATEWQPNAGILSEMLDDGVEQAMHM